MPTPRRALIVIDVQNEYVTGDLLIEYPDVQTSLSNIGRAIDTARAARIPVVVVQNFAPAGSPVFARGSEGAQLHAVVASRQHDHYVEKDLPSAFTNTDLAGWLAAHEIGTLTVVGYMTHNCDASTIVHALHMGLAVEFLHDATGSVPYENSAGFASAEEIHRVYSVVLQSRFAAVASTQQWVEAVESGGQLERGSIYASNRKARAKSAA
ncbi:cysteine hydrolase family protein [Paraburkholderia phymatum]|uniref:Isochorismatase hydrolase n=1 Tax=Paraburkholderia phymatum (strain DSM 17167 / CIP 108236 / LMG 21445 / STM815) TaxID=391038 RepID=B2JDF1_PARP8|nr:cysteine hydrolase family protein [Paraburkholderia phymatum]ACC69668.1 isochorismatase hydrolase [Paraburkholderia phymatum STM815]